MPEIKIKPIANFHSDFLLVLGVALLCVAIALSHHFWQSIRLVLILLIMASIVFIFIGIVKKLEPNFSFQLTPNQLTFYHKYGQWQINWQDIQRIGEVNIHTGLTQQQLPYIGIKLKSENTIAKTLSVRLASRLPHEQRPLTTAAITQSLISLEQGQLNFSPYQLSDGRKLTGPLALYFHHSNALLHAYGYHLFIPASAIDRPLPDFIALLKQCLAHRVHYD